MEIKLRMSTRFAWLLGVVVLVSIGLLVACGTTYNSSSDGLVLVGSQGSAAIQTFSFNLGTGHMSSVYNSTSSTIASTCILPGLPASIVLDPAGAFAYTIINAAEACNTTTTTTINGIMAFKVNSDGTMSQIGLTPDPNPVALFMDSAGKFLFVAEGLGGTVESFAIGGGAGLTAVPGAFTLPAAIQPPNFSALAATPTVFPGIGLNGVKNSVCAGTAVNPPTTEFLYVTDAVNNVVLEFGVDPSTGALGNPDGFTSIQVSPVGAVPSGVAVDPCDRFVYVANNQSNTVSAFTICNGLSTQNQKVCPIVANGQLVPLSNSPFSLSGGGANLPGPLAVDPYGNTLYVVGTGSSTISIFSISPVSGSLTPGKTSTVTTGLRPTSIAIRSDDSWLFVTDFLAGTVSQYSITPATGELSPQPPVTTDNYPWGVAVK
jgi:6-phosphogluconolactonase (cycloisomerase 2 family)